MESLTKVVTLPLAMLVEDMSIYPRHAVDDAHVARLVKALETGVTLPPLVACAETKRLTDGWHRKRALVRMLGPKGSVDVELRTYTSDGERILDAIQMNSAHGRPLDKQDMVRSVILAENAGISLQRVAVVLHQTEREVEKYTVRVALVPPGSPGTIPGTQHVALKRPLLHLAGKHLTAEQANAQPSVPGTSYLLLAQQLRDAVNHHLANKDDQRLMQAFRDLRDDLVRYFG